MDIEIITPFIKLDSLLKFANVLESGGMAKKYIIDGVVCVNGEIEIRRGKKIYPGDTVTIDEMDIQITVK